MRDTKIFLIIIMFAIYKFFNFKVLKKINLIKNKMSFRKIKKQDEFECIVQILSI